MTSRAHAADVGTEDRFVEHLRRLEDDLKGTVGRGLSVLDEHRIDESARVGRRPLAVVYARTTADVSTTLAWCSNHGVPVVPFGAGSSLSGHVLLDRPGIVLDLAEMDRVLEVDDVDLVARVQPGVRRIGLNELLQPCGVFFSVDPGADATIGGMIATGASGSMTPGYGTMRENVLTLECVLADGTVIRTGGRSRKSVAGLDLTRLLVGSEGTLAVVTEATVRLHPNPESVVAVTCGFDTPEQAVDTVLDLTRAGVSGVRTEYLSSSAIAAVNAHAELDLPVRPTLFLELHGSPGAVRAAVDEVEELVADGGGSDLAWSDERGQRDRLWRARHHAYFAVLARRPGARAVTTDVCVPVSRLAEVLVQTEAESEELPFPSLLVAHAADGNFHVIMAIDPNDEQERRQVADFYDRLVRRALAAGGTCTGEHGVGSQKMNYLVDELGPAVDVMRQIKSALDPDDVLNPGKVYYGSASPTPED